MTADEADRLFEMELLSMLLQGMFLEVIFRVERVTAHRTLVISRHGNCSRLPAGYSSAFHVPPIVGASVVTGTRKLAEWPAEYGDCV